MGKIPRKRDLAKKRQPEVVRRDSYRFTAETGIGFGGKSGNRGSESADGRYLRAEPETLVSLIDGQKYFPGYHMNKKHWISVLPQDDEDLNKICKAIDISYALAAKPKK